MATELVKKILQNDQHTLSMDQRTRLSLVAERLFEIMARYELKGSTPGTNREVNEIYRYVKNG